MRPSVTLGVVVHNEASQILDFLQHIQSQDFAEIIFVDNASTDNTAQIITDWLQESSKTDTFFLPRDFNSMAAARNDILKSSSSPWVYFTDADCRIDPRKWDHMLKNLDWLLQQGEEPAALGGGNTPPPERKDLIAESLLAMQKIWLAHMNSIQIKPPETLAKVNLLSTCNLLLKKSPALACGGFDEDFISVGEDLSLCHRLRMKGFDLWSSPNSEVIHHHTSVLSRWCIKMLRYGEAQINVAKRYPSHMSGLRGLQFILLLVFVLSIPLLGPWMLGVLFFYFLWLVIESKKIKTALFILLSQMFYGMGEVLGLAKILWSFIKIPVRIPSLEKK